MTLAIVDQPTDTVLPPDALAACAAAAGVDERILSRAIELALEGGPDEIVEGWW